jgi:hypothetical protein
VKEGSKHTRKKARELKERVDDLIERGKELVNQTKDQTATGLVDADQPA